jgi:Domain of unknown function (DUF4412)
MSLVGARATRHAATVAACLGLLSLTGCGKLKAALGIGGDEAGAPAAGSAGGGGALSFLGTDFEGEISAVVTTKDRSQNGAPQQIVFGIKKPKYRIDMTGGATTGTPRPDGGTPVQRPASGSFLVDAPAKKGWLLAPAQKMAMAIDFEKMKSLPKGHVPGLPNAPKVDPAHPPTIDKTGKKDVVAGYSCDVWNVTNGSTKAEVCVAEGITWIDLSDLGWASTELTVAAAASGVDRFPLRVVTFDAHGAEETRMVVTKVDKKNLDDARFSVPEDYRVLDIGAIMGGVGGAPLGAPRTAPPKAR